MKAPLPWPSLTSTSSAPRPAALHNRVDITHQQRPTLLHTFRHPAPLIEAADATATSPCRSPRILSSPIIASMLPDRSCAALFDHAGRPPPAQIFAHTGRLAVPRPQRLSEHISTNSRVNGLSRGRDPVRSTPPGVAERTNVTFLIRLSSRMKTMKLKPLLLGLTARSSAGSCRCTRTFGHCVILNRQPSR